MDSCSSAGHTQRGAKMKDWDVTGSEVQKMALREGWPKGKAAMDGEVSYWDFTNAVFRAWDWLNKNVAPTGHMFVFVDGDFILVSDEEEMS